MLLDHLTEMLRTKKMTIVFNCNIDSICVVHRHILTLLSSWCSLRIPPKIMVSPDRTSKCVLELMALGQVFRSSTVNSLQLNTDLSFFIEMFFSHMYSCHLLHAYNILSS